MTHKTTYTIKFRWFTDHGEETHGEPYETFKDAVEERNWFIGHTGSVMECWIEKITMITSRNGAKLKRSQPNGKVV